ncbi:unnamed protein product, partial [Bubo scandiacus]
MISWQFKNSHLLSQLKDPSAHFCHGITVMLLHLLLLFSINPSGNGSPLGRRETALI